jgi:hypothetical protein
MHAVETRVAIGAGLLLLAAISGVAVSSMGRPLNLVVATLHKLIAVSSVVFAVLLVVAMARTGGIDTSVLVMIIVSGALFLSLFATGAFLSVEGQVSTVLRAAHTAIPFLTLASTLLLAYIRLRASP